MIEFKCWCVELCLQTCIWKCCVTLNCARHLWFSYFGKVRSLLVKWLCYTPFINLECELRCCSSFNPIKGILDKNKNYIGTILLARTVLIFVPGNIKCRYEHNLRPILTFFETTPYETQNTIWNLSHIHTYTHPHIHPHTHPHTYPLIHTFIHTLIHSSKTTMLDTYSRTKAYGCQFIYLLPWLSQRKDTVNVKNESVYMYVREVLYCLHVLYEWIKGPTLN